MLFVVNPTAAGGSVGRHWPDLESRIRSAIGDMEVEYTSEPWSAVSLVRSALRRGKSDIAIVGGDGSVNEVLNGFIEDDRLVDRDARLTIIPVGSGCDYAKALGLPSGLEHAQRLLRSEVFRTVDVGKATYRSLQGTTETRYFANILEAGAGGAVVDKVNRSSKPFGGRFAFMWAIITTLPSYTNEVVEVRVDGELVAEEPMNSVIVANGMYYGSGLKPAPKAELDDGIFDLVLFGDIHFGDALRNLGKLRKGELVEHPKVKYLRGKSVSATAQAEVLAEMDGELVGTLPMDVTILPHLLQVRVLGD
ncbi:MAG: diacylglycerol kinase family protein [Thermoplasmata archaeon]